MAGQQRGKLKIFMGYAAGVGKTYKMLEEAHQLKAAGVDIGAPISPEVAEKQKLTEELSAVNAQIKLATKTLLEDASKTLQTLRNTAKRAMTRLAAIEAGGLEKFRGEADFAREAISMTARDIRRCDAAYTILAFGAVVDREQFVCDVESRDGLIDAALARGFVLDDNGRRFEVGR